jgi:hypothetical protein
MTDDEVRDFPGLRILDAVAFLQELSPKGKLHLKA